MYAIFPKGKDIDLTYSFFGDEICHAGIKIFGIPRTKSSRSRTAVPILEREFSDKSFMKLHPNPSNYKQ